LPNNYRDLETPYFILDKLKLDNNITGLKSSLEKFWPNYMIGYSFKTNTLPWLLKYLLKNKFYAEVVSVNEYKLARAIGYPQNQIIYNGPVKNQKTFNDALLNETIVNMDSQVEIEWLVQLLETTTRNFNVGLRVHFAIEDACPDEIGYEEDGTRFGFSVETGELYRVIDRLLTTGRINIAGLHLHSTSKTRSIKVYRELAKMACRIKEHTHISFEYIDIGGGFFGGVPGKPAFDEYLTAIKQELQKAYNVSETKLILEPGSAIIGSPVSFVSSVIDAKDTLKSRIVTIDGSRMNIDPIMRKKMYSFDVWTEEGVKKIIPKQIVCGFTCMDLDRLMVLKDHAALAVGDRIVFNRVGSYTMSLNPLFINLFPVVYIKENNDIYVGREAMKISDYLQIGSLVD